MRHARARSARWGLVAVALAAVVLAAVILAAALAGCSSGASGQARSSGTQAAGGGPQTIQVQVTGNHVQTASKRVKVKLDSQVRLEVTADRADEVHLHGYDRKVELQPGKQATLEFTADTPGVFEVELEEAGLKLLELQVQ